MVTPLVANFYRTQPQDEALKECILELIESQLWLKRLKIITRQVEIFLVYKFMLCFSC